MHGCFSVLSPFCVSSVPSVLAHAKAQRSVSVLRQRGSVRLLAACLWCLSSFRSWCGAALALHQIVTLTTRTPCVIASLQVPASCRDTYYEWPPQFCIIPTDMWSFQFLLSFIPYRSLYFQGLPLHWQVELGKKLGKWNLGEFFSLDKSTKHSYFFFFRSLSKTWPLPQVAAMPICPGRVALLSLVRDSLAAGQPPRFRLQAGKPP